MINLCLDLSLIRRVKLLLSNSYNAVEFSSVVQAQVDHPAGGDLLLFRLLPLEVQPVSFDSPLDALLAGVGLDEGVQVLLVGDHEHLRYVS